MTGFALPADLAYNRGLIEDPGAYAKAGGFRSWLYLVGDEFAAMPGGMSYAQVQAAVPSSARVVSDPPRVLSVELARQHIAALDTLPRPTLVSCRTGPRGSAVAYLYAGLKRGATYDEVLAAAEREQAPFCASAEIKEWLRTSLETLRSETR
ncbi:MAG TPA: hypothetical protein VL563_00810 [Gemmatimonadales bacterium]|nr:hypothetical protein [Gemmatimonadales bacterium]